ncbi:MAG: DHA2 family efflux MFS transporter permease subunit [Solirubrobacteraceae bacterium]|jgi:EmrB/QacA subfamily drug resistance transporter
MAEAAEQTDRIEPWVWRIAGVVVLGSIMSILDTTIVNVALATLHDDLHSPLADIQWVITGYLLALAVVIPLSGWASRRFGAKRIYLTSIVLFTAGSALCGFAGSTTTLILFRVLQGIGGGMIMPVGQMILAGAAGPRRMGRVMAITGVPTMLAPIIGPTVGGLLIDTASWRWIFFVNVPIGIIATYLAVRLIPAAERDRSHAQPLDLIGLALLATGLPLLTYGLAEIGTTGTFSSPKVLVSIPLSLVLIAAFVFHALRAKVPLLDLSLYRRNTYAAASAAMFFLGGALFGVMIVLPLYFQNVRHESVLDTGLLLAPQGVGMAMMMPVVGRLTDRVGGGPLAIIGVVITALIGIPFGLIGAHTSLVLLGIEQVIRGVGIGFAFMPAYIAAMAALDRSELPDAAPQLNVLMRVGGSLGTAILAVVLQRTLTAAGPRPAIGTVAGAYGTAFWWGAAIITVAIVPCVILMRAERSARRARRDQRGDGSELAPLAEAA